MMCAAVGFVGVLLRRAGPRHSKWERDWVRFDTLICVGRLVLRERGNILGSGTSGNIVQKIVDVGSTERQSCMGPAF